MQLSRLILIFLLVFGSISCESDKEKVIERSSNQNPASSSSEVFYRLRVFDSRQESAALKKLDKSKIYPQDLLLIYGDHGPRHLNQQEALSYQHQHLKHVQAEVYCHIEQEVMHKSTSFEVSTIAFHQVLPEPLLLWFYQDIECELSLVATFSSGSTNTTLETFTLKASANYGEHALLDSLNFTSVSAEDLICQDHNKQIVKAAFQVADLQSCRLVKQNSISELYINKEIFNISTRLQKRSQRLGHIDSPRFDVYVENLGTKLVEIKLNSVLGVFQSYTGTRVQAYVQTDGYLVLDPAEHGEVEDYSTYTLEPGAQMRLTYKLNCVELRNVPALELKSWGYNAQTTHNLLFYRIAGLKNFPFYKESSLDNLNIETYASDKYGPFIRGYQRLAYSAWSKDCTQEP